MSCKGAALPFQAHSNCGTCSIDFGYLIILAEAGNIAKNIDIFVSIRGQTSARVSLQFIKFVQINICNNLGPSKILINKLRDYCYNPIEHTMYFICHLYYRKVLNNQRVNQNNVICKYHNNFQTIFCLIFLLVADLYNRDTSVKCS